MCHHIHYDGGASDVQQLPFATPVVHVSKHRIACVKDGCVKAQAMLGHSIFYYHGSHLTMTARRPSIVVEVC